MGKSGAVVAVGAAVALAVGMRSAAAEPGHRGPMFGAALMMAAGKGDDGGPGGELLLGWAHGRLAGGLWSRVAMEVGSGDLHVMIGGAARWWSAAFERLYVEGRLGVDRVEILDYEEPLDGPPGDGPTRTGAFAGAAVGIELVRHPVVIPLDLRAGLDYVVLDRDRKFAWVALGLTFY